MVGEDRERTRIRVLRVGRDWRKSHPDDWGLLSSNIGTDVTGRDHRQPDRANDYGKDHDVHDHQFASARWTTPIARILHANVIADGGDTLSLWNHDTGLSYYDDRTSKAGCDFVCPRAGIHHKQPLLRSQPERQQSGTTAAGTGIRSLSCVIRNSTEYRESPSDGIIATRSSTCSTLSSAPASPIVPSTRCLNRIEQLGERYYYKNVLGAGGDSAWFADNLRTAAGSPRDEDITDEWTSADDGIGNAAGRCFLCSDPSAGERMAMVDPSGVTLRWTPGRNRACRTRLLRYDEPSRVSRRTNEDGRSRRAACRAARPTTGRVDAVTADGIVAVLSGRFARIRARCASRSSATRR